MIEVTYEVSSTAWHNIKKLELLNAYSILSFDIETKGLYSKIERKAALQFLENEDIDIPLRKAASIVAHNSGLSFPSLISVSHFVFGTSNSTSVILIVNSWQEELMVWKWVSKYLGLLLVHNTLFDLKVMYHRVNQFPMHYEDTALMAKTLINNSKIWKSKIGLKDLMGDLYTPEWTLIDEYEPENPHDAKFLRYASIDGAATFKLYELLLEEFGNQGPTPK